MKILLLTDGIFPFEIGGMQKHAYYLAKHLLQKNIDLTIYHCVVDKDIPKNVEEELKQSFGLSPEIKVNSKCFKFPRLKFPVLGHYVIESYLYSKIIYNELKKDLPYDFIYAKGFSAWYSLKNKSNLPKIGVQFHGLEMFQPSSSIKHHLDNFLFRIPTKTNLELADCIFSYGGKVKNILLDIGISEEKIQLQYGGIDKAFLISEEEIKPVEERKKFVFIGRNERRKGYIELKQALSSIINEYDFNFSFVGQIDEIDKIKTDKITYYGNITNATKYFDVLDANDVIVVPSISEGVPTVLLEAMCRGLTVIATDVGAIDDIVNEQNGFLIQPKKVDVLKNTIISVIKMRPEDIHTKQKNALKFISKNFGWDHLSDKLIEFLKQEIKL